MRIGMMTDVDKPYFSRVTNHISFRKEYIKKAKHAVFIFTVGNRDHADFEQRVVRSAGQPLTGTNHALRFHYGRCVKNLMLTLQLMYAHNPNFTGRLENLRP
ncbi:MAG: hypothetical protein ABSA01_11120 [Anaerolineales bacterium]|jgi:23S rRNA-/tRNA-specific pseudouridylate synthase